MLAKGQAHRHGLSDMDDYFYDADGTLQIRVSYCEDSRDFKLIATHALIGAFANEWLGITPAMVDKWDAKITEGQPGDNPDCPYFLSHQAASAGKRALGIVLQRVVETPRDLSGK